MGVGGARPPPFTLFTITYKVAVYAPDAEVRLQKPIFHFTYKLPFSKCRWRSGAAKNQLFILNLRKSFYSLNACGSGAPKQQFLILNTRKSFHSLNAGRKWGAKQPVFHFEYSLKLPISECRWRSGAPHGCWRVSSSPKAPT